MPGTSEERALVEVSREGGWKIRNPKSEIRNYHGEGGWKFRIPNSEFRIHVGPLFESPNVVSGNLPFVATGKNVNDADLLNTDRRQAAEREVDDLAAARRRVVADPARWSAGSDVDH